jgi:membrane protease YdiL (CAAX protease family)
MVIPSIAEEPGWRGFALPRLQQRYGPIVGSLILGLLHGLWHIPAIMTIMVGPLPLANYAPFMLTAIMITMLYTWIYNHTRGSVLIAMLVHAASNAAAQWETAVVQEAGLELPRTGLAGFLSSTTWNNTIGYVLVALLLITLTRGRLGVRTPADEAVACVNG